MNPVARIRFLRAASDSILAQAAYYATHESVKLEVRWLGAVQKSIDQLKYMPESCPRANFGEAFPPDLRRAVISGFSDFLIFYRYDAGQHVVNVVAVLPGCMDLEQTLQDIAMDEE
ncbi:MAG: type II toxin-antitoxin system RelE/ParE family toxin [Acidobacteriaceae bacterium]|nr:type II toxin-antitoxin system RelE/ParE family toxin [Acidobacteriaceae bacterium]